jgi:DNA-binding HxlR family transcriptional regulator
MAAVKRDSSSGRTACPIRDVLHRVGDRWSLLVLCTLAENGALRFGAIRSRIEDISMRMLVQTLRRLEQDGFLSRTVYPTNPPCVEYSLTSLGLSLQEVVSELVRWARRNRQRVHEARRRFSENAGGGMRGPLPRVKSFEARGIP